LIGVTALPSGRIPVIHDSPGTETQFVDLSDAQKGMPVRSTGETGVEFSAPARLMQKSFTQ